MQVNTDIIETTHDIDALIRIAHTNPSVRLRDKLISLEVDIYGTYVGYAESNYIWRNIIRDAA